VEVNMTQQAFKTRGASEESGTAREVAGEATQAARTATQEVAGTAKEQARQVTGEVRAQASRVGADVRDMVSEQARTQNEKLAGGIRGLADELDNMAADREDSPARTVVTRIAEGGRQVADYLAERGPEGVLAEVQDFARRRPGAFLATALVTGFVVGRLGKGIMSGTSERPQASGAATSPLRGFSTMPTETAGMTQPSAGMTRPSVAPEPIITGEERISSTTAPMGSRMETGTGQADLTTPTLPPTEGGTR
jgi:hypothetical protein